MTTKDELLARIYGARSNRDLSEGYDGWAGDYDGDMERRGYRLPGIVTCLVARYVPPAEGPILDAGAGTGLLGEWLRLAGYRDVTGIDLSAGMLALAGKTGAYRELRQMTLGEPLAFPDDHFRAVASAGTFGATHAPASGFDELVRIARPGGHLVLSIRVEGMEAAGFPAALARLEAEGRWRLVETVGPFQAMRSEPASLYVVHVCEVA
jgi:SAM-dependent methyltransferase